MPTRTLAWTLLMGVLALPACKSEAPPAPKKSATSEVAAPTDAKATPKAPKAAEKPKTDKGTTYAELLAGVDRQIKTQVKMVEANKDWTRLERLAGFHMRRARITGDWDDYEKADNALKEAFSLSKKGSGPFMTRAGLNFTLHRFGAVDADLDAYSKRLMLKKPQLSAIVSMRADLLAYRGQIEKAKAAYREAQNLAPKSMQAHARAAILHARLGDYKAAEAGLETAAGLVSKRDALGISWMHLQKGLLDLDRNRLDDAMAHYKDADAALQGWWLIEEHIAEIHALQNRHDEAQKMYQDLIERTNSPEFMGALADSLEATGRTDKAKAWRDKATARYEAQLARFPEAAWGHALDHFLGTEPTSDRTIDIARKNHALRPGPESSHLLAEALIARGEHKAARPLVDGALKTGWSTPDFLGTAAALYGHLGEPEEAKKLCARANAIAPETCSIP